MGVLEKITPFHHHADASEPAPPAYVQNQPPPQYPYSEASTAPQKQPASQPPRLRFPAQFNVYTHFSTFTIGPHQDDKLFTVIQTGIRKPLTLVEGGDKKAPPLSTLKMKGLGATSVLTIFPHEGGEVSEPLEVTVENHSSKHNFCVAIPNQAPQFFEWRTSKSDEVQALGLCKHGWKLVWLRKDGGGEEIVAASALNNTMSMTKGLGFGFCNGGLNGTLGDTFHVAAVTTAMSIFEVYMINVSSA